MVEKVIPIRLDEGKGLTPSIPGQLLAASTSTKDTRGRPLRDLRISVTDRCNFRCTYCMRKEIFDKDYPYLSHHELLSFEEITRLTTIFASLGVEKIRLTGGEPLLRKNLEVLIEMLAKIRTTVDGKRMFTPMLVVFIAIAATDVMFAFDSIPAIFGITTDPFIVFTANIFALMGLRQLYFLLGGLLDKLEYLKYGIAFILGFIGVKLVSHAMHVNELPFINGGKHIEWAPEISSNLSLAVIVGAIAISALASILVSKREAKSKG